MAELHPFYRTKSDTLKINFDSYNHDIIYLDGRIEFVFRNTCALVVGMCRQEICERNGIQVFDADGELFSDPTNELHAQYEMYTDDGPLSDFQPTHEHLINAMDGVDFDRVSVWMQEQHTDVVLWAMNNEVKINGKETAPAMKQVS